jgi:hypothetical protein
VGRVRVHCVRGLPRREGRSAARGRLRDVVDPAGLLVRLSRTRLDDPSFELSFWCGTCQFLFHRLEGANRTLSIDTLSSLLAEGLDDIDDHVVQAFGELLELGT